MFNFRALVPLLISYEENPGLCGPRFPYHCPLIRKNQTNNSIQSEEKQQALCYLFIRLHYTDLYKFRRFVISHVKNFN